MGDEGFEPATNGLRVHWLITQYQRFSLRNLISSSFHLQAEISWCLLCVLILF